MVRYGTLDSSGRPVYAGTTLVVDGVPYANAPREMWLKAGKKPFLGSGANPPKSKREGWHYERDGWQEQAAAFVPKWKLVEDAPQVLYVSKAKVEAAVDRMGLTAAFTDWLNSKAAYIGEWMRGGDTVPYDPADNAGDLASLISALGIPQENVAALIAEVKVS